MARREDASVTGLDALKGRRVGTLSNSLAWELLLRSGAQAIPYEGVEEPYIDLEQGRVDAVLMDDLDRPALRHAAREPAVVGDVGEGYYAIAVNKGEDDLRQALDDALGRIARSGELRAILRRWNIDSAAQQRMVDWTEAQTREVLSADAHHAHGLAGSPAVPPGGGGNAAGVGGRHGARDSAGNAAGAGAPLRAPVAGRAGHGVCGAAPGDTGAASALRPLLRAGERAEAGPLTAAILGLGLNYAAYESEVYRAGILAVPRGQMEAALALGMPTRLALRRVVIPQAFRVALPGVTNDFIALLKDSSLVSVISVVELTKRMTITAVDVRSWLLPGALCAALYLAMSYPLSRLARRLEAKLERA